MCEIKINFDQVEKAIAVMREVSAWGREQGYRVWSDEWLTKDELITSDAQPENFCIGRLMAKSPALSFCNVRTAATGPMHPSMKLLIFINSACGANSPGWA